MRSRDREPRGWEVLERYQPRYSPIGGMHPAMGGEYKFRGEYNRGMGYGRLVQPADALVLTARGQDSGRVWRRAVAVPIPCNLSPIPQGYTSRFRTYLAFSSMNRRPAGSTCSPISV